MRDSIIVGSILGAGDFWRLPNQSALQDSKFVMLFSIAPCSLANRNRLTRAANKSIHNLRYDSSQLSTAHLTRKKGKPRLEIILGILSRAQQDHTNTRILERTRM